MSGFVGLANTGGAPVDTPLLDRLTGAMAYCGPDGQNTWTDDTVGLGHALLRVNPHAPGAETEHQPATLDGRTWVVADARIDGRPELVRELRAAGRDVGADAAGAHLVLHAHAAWGERCPEHLIGDFAFAVWDGERRELLCARDHFGVVPFYYARTAHGLAFGNVLQVLLAHPEVSDAVNDQAIGDFLAFDWNEDLTTTAFADVRSLPPAHTLTWRDGVVGVRRYWELDPAPPVVRCQDPPEYVERFAAALDRAVDDRLRGSRVATQLSGGMDSSSVAATARQVLQRRPGPVALRAFNMGFRDGGPGEDEGRYAREIASRVDIPLETIDFDEEMTGAGDGEGRWVFPEPMRITEEMLEYALLTRASGFARQLLTGQGGDPLFGGRPSRRAQLRSGKLPRPGVRRALRRRRGGVYDLPDWIDDGLADRVGLRERGAAIAASVGHPKGVALMASPFWATAFARAHPGALGLRIRLLFPFFDLRLVRCVAETPPLPWHADKHLLREALRDRLPESVLRRPKTLLYAPRSARPEPILRLAGRPEIRRRREALLEVPGLERYVDVTRARRWVESPTSPGMFQFERCLALAQWLQTRKDQRAGTTP